MRDSQNPVETMISISKHKYILLSLPIFIIIACFVLKVLNVYLFFTKPLIMIAFITYLLIIYIFRFDQPHIEINESNLLAPINGKIREIKKLDNSYQILVEKGFSDKAEIRTMTNLDKSDFMEEIPSFSIKGVWTRIYSDKNPHIQGLLIGIAPGRAVAVVNVPFSYELSVQNNNSINAGTTILATSRNSSSISNIGRDDE